MKSIKFFKILLDDQWKENITFILDDEGKILSTTSEDVPTDLQFMGPAIPGFINAHSHAFQYAMAGLTENNSGLKDDFWSWREIMYSIALGIGPDQLQGIARMLYSEMLRNGYTQVVEFHYIHHDKDGKPYTSRSELGERLIAAAEEAGIGITLVPIFYQKGGFGLEASKMQRRFLSTNMDDYLLLAEACHQAVNKSPMATMGHGVHSLRAVNPDDVIAAFGQLSKKGPFHIHVSEQQQEIRDCLQFHRQRPIEWLHQHVELHDNIHLVHATHIDEGEMSAIRQTGAHVVLCPTTEGNLGDGTFPFRTFLNSGGCFSIGSDSHIGLSPLEELRWIDYQQRLLTHKRAVYQEKGQIGDMLFQNTLKSGQAAAGLSFNEVDQPLNVLILDSDHPHIYGTKDNQLINSLIYAGDSSAIDTVISRGKVVVEKGMHKNRDEIRSAYHNAIQNLAIR